MPPIMSPIAVSTARIAGHRKLRFRLSREVLRQASNGPTAVRKIRNSPIGTLTRLKNGGPTVTFEPVTHSDSTGKSVPHNTAKTGRWRGPQQGIHSLNQRGEADVGQVAGCFCPGLSQFRVAIEEDSEHAQTAAEFDVGVGVADHDAGGCFDGGEVGEGLVEEAGQRLAAVALLLVVRAKVEAVDVSAVGLQQALQCGVDGDNIGGGVTAQGDAALVRDP